MYSENAFKIFIEYYMLKIKGAQYHQYDEALIYDIWYGWYWAPLAKNP